MIQAYHEQGVPKAEIARVVGVDRKTVARVLACEQPPAGRRIVVPGILDPFKPYIDERLSRYDLPATRLFREIQARGYTGSYETVKRYVAKVRERRPKPAYVRFETEPGEQAQVDWACFGKVLLGGRWVRLWCFCMVLGYSRAMYVEFTCSQDLATFIRAHINAFRYFGGTTATILYDNLKSVVLSREGSSIQWNPHFLAFSKAYGFRPILCTPGHPESKGKIERVFPYIRRDFFLGTDFDGLEDLNQKARRWLDEVANRRVHGTTRAVPFERLKEEKLKPIPDGDWVVDVTEVRQVSKDCLVSYDANLYSVPHYLAGKEVSVRADGSELLVYFRGELVARHTLCPDKGRIIRLPEHIEGAPRPVYPTRIREVRAQFAEAFPQAEAFVQGLIRVKCGNAKYHMIEVLKLLETYPREVVASAIDRATRFGAFDCRTVRNICAQSGSGLPTKPPAPPPSRAVRPRVEFVQVHVRPLEEYAVLERTV